MAEEIFNINLNYNGLYFNAQVDRETYEEVNKDPELLQRYTKQIYQQCFQQVGAGIPETSSPLKEVEVPSENLIRWNDQLTKLLINERLEKEGDFAHPKCRKIKLWQELAKKISKTCNVCITADNCSTKYRNLLATYRSNKRKQQSTGESAIVWEYFQKFDSVLGTKISSGIPPSEIVGSSLVRSETVGSSLITITKNTSCTRGNPDVSAATDENIPVQMTKKRKNTSMSFQTYLATKIKKEDAREKLKEEQEKEKVLKEEKRWKEKKELKEKEINAILELAKAIAEKKN